MRVEQKVKADGAMNFFGGLDSRRNPAFIEANQVAFAVNTVFRGGYASQRPPFYQRALTFPDSESLTWFQTKNLQAAIQYRDYVACVIAGRIFLINTTSYSVVEISPKKTAATTASFMTPAQGATVVVAIDTSIFSADMPIYVQGQLYTFVSKTATNMVITNVSGTAGLNIPTGTNVATIDQNLPDIPHAWMIEAEQYLIVQDGASAAIIYDGASRRADPVQQEVPSGTAMAYGNGRLWVTINKRQFIAGDINHGPSDIINFTENSFIAGGGAFSVPGDAGDITAMVFMPTMDTSLGQGPLLVMTENSIYSVSLPFSRLEWANTDNPIQTMALRGFGPTSIKSVVLVNGDLFYRSRDGMRSLVLAIREFGTWGNVPFSTELARVIDQDPPNLLDQCSAAVFDNRLLFTTSLQPDGFGCYSNALASMDFDPISFQGKKGPPIWDGFWTGVDFRMLVSGYFDSTERCFMFTRDTDGLTQFWEILKKGDFDSGDCRISSFIETRSHDFGSQFELKRLEDGEIWFDNVRGDVDFDIKYKQDQSPCWKNWTSWDECQTAKDCAAGDCWTPMVQWPGYRTRKAFRTPQCLDDLGDLKPSILGYEFQARIQWTGRARIRRYLLITREEEEANTGRVD